MTFLSQLLPRFSPATFNLRRRVLAHHRKRNGAGVRAYFAEARRAFEAEHRFSELRRKDPQALAGQGVARYGIPRRIFEELFAG